MDTAETLPQFQHQPLKSLTSLRIFVLRPAAGFQDNLEGTIHQVDREEVLKGWGDVGQYEAISYHWGAVDMTHTITLHDCTVSITKNVDMMLRYLRSRSKVRNLWIDAICLNQHDADEMNIQVPLMGEIYQQAIKVRIWLGEAMLAEHLSEVFATLRSLAVYATHAERSKSRPKPNALPSMAGKDYTPEIKQFFQREWFKRRWVLQEAALGHDITVHCGHAKMDWEWFLGGVKYLLQEPEHTFTWDATTALSTLQALRNTPGHNLLDLLWHFHMSRCSKPQDTIFALYGIARDSASISTIEYSHSWNETFTNVAEHYFETSGAEMWKHLFHFKSLSDANVHEKDEWIAFPSWVPDWSNRRIQLWIPQSVENRLAPSLKQTCLVDNNKVPLLRIRSCYGGYFREVQDVTQISQILPRSPEALENFCKITCVILLGATGDLASSYEFLLYVKQHRVPTYQIIKSIHSYFTELQNNILRNKGGLDAIVERAIKPMLHDHDLVSIDEGQPDRSVSGDLSRSHPMGLASKEARKGDILLYCPYSFADRSQIDILGIGLIVRPVQSFVWPSKNALTRGVQQQFAGRFRYVGHCLYPYLPTVSQEWLTVDLE